MTKAIAELAKQYAEDMCPIGDYCGGVYDEQRHSDLPIYADDAKSVLSWLFGKPLASRLTPEEKERVKVIYNEELGMAQHFHAKAKASNDISCRQHYYGLREPYISRMKLLERIFGSDFFKEGEWV